MSARHSYTTADYLPFDTATNLVRKLYKDGNYRMSLLIGCGIFFGLRISDLRTLKWDQILSKDEFSITEKKTGKRRVIRINKGFQGHIRDCYEALCVTDLEEPCFINRYGKVTSIQMINRQLKVVRFKYRLQINNFSTHSLRKTWARAIWEQENNAGRGELALIKLSALMNHSAPNVTRAYIGLRQQELGDLYENLQF